MACIILEDLVRRHFSDRHCDSCVHQVDYLTSPDKVHQRNDHKPYEEASAADDECVLESHDISESEDCGSGVDLQEDLGLVGYGCSPWENLCCECFTPESECGYDEVVETSDESADKKGLCSLAAAFSANEDLSGRSRFRERILSVLFLYEILSERNEEKYSEDTSEQRGEEYLSKVYCKFRILVLKDEECRKGEDSSCHNRSGA